MDQKIVSKSESGTFSYCQSPTSLPTARDWRDEDDVVSYSDFGSEVWNANVSFDAAA